MRGLLMHSHRRCERCFQRYLYSFQLRLWIFRLENHSEILRKLDELQRNDSTQDKQILLIFEYLKQLEQAKKEDQRFKERKRIGFKRSEEG